MKLCTKCRQEKELDAFSKCKNNKDGLQYICKVCGVRAFTVEQRKEKAKYDKRRRASLTPEDKARDNEMHLIAVNKRREEFKAYQLKWQRENREKCSAYTRKHRKTNSGARITMNLRARINSALHGHHRSKRMTELLGCSIDEFKAYIANLFEPGMSWDNYGYRTWHLDHIKPCVDFELSDPKQQELCFHYSNVQPLWAADNWKKGGRT